MDAAKRLATQRCDRETTNVRNVMSYSIHASVLGDDNKCKIYTKLNVIFRRSSSSLVSSTEKVGSSPEIRSEQASSRKGAILRNAIRKVKSMHERPHANI